MDTGAFLARFVRDAEAVASADYGDFFATVLRRPEHRDTLIAWLAAASARPFSVRVAGCLIAGLTADVQPIDLPEARRAVNIVGAGGGRATFNISTSAAFVAAAAGARVLKSGSPAYNSLSGSSDVLQALGVTFDADEGELADGLTRFGLAFVPLAAYPAVLRRMASTVQPLPFKAIAGIVNRIGPMLCPYRVGAQLTGVPERGLLDPYAQVLRASGVQRGWVVHAEAGLDELCSLSMNHIVSLHGEDAVHLDPASFGCAAAPLESLAGERPVGAARIVEALLSNQGSRAQEDTVLLNAAAVLVLAEAERDLHAAFERCRRALRKGQALRLLEGLREHARKRRYARIAKHPVASAAQEATL